MDPDAEARTQDAEEGALPAGTGALPRRSRVFTANIDAEVEEATAADVATALPARRSRRDTMQTEPLDPPEGANEPATLGALPADTPLHERRRTPPRRGRIALTEDIGTTLRAPRIQDHRKPPGFDPPFPLVPSGLGVADAGSQPVVLQPAPQLASQAGPARNTQSGRSHQLW